ncbi:MAG: hypothetical protein ACOZF0_07550 [Thermodesulfobacteriota bacterium]
MNPQTVRPGDSRPIPTVAKHIFHGLFLVFLAIPAMLAISSEQATADPFGKGMVRTSLSVGWGSAFQNDYTIIGGGVGYYIIDCLELGLDAEYWIGDSPVIYKVSPEMRYVLRLQSALKPYAGIFYRYTAISLSYDDINSAGLRAGVYYNTGGNLYIGAGVVYEQYLDRDEKQYDYGSQTYPEVSLTVAF